MKFITISIYISLCILFVGCKKTNSSTNEMCNCSVESIEDELEMLCLKSKNDSMTLSMEITSDNMVNDYNYRYLGSLQVSSRMFEVLQKTVLSGQYKDAQRNKYLPSSKSAEVISWSNAASFSLFSDTPPP